MNTLPLIRQNEPYKTGIGRHLTNGNICLAVIFGCMLLTGFVPQVLLSCAVLLSSALLIGSRKIYLVYPPMLFYYTFFGQLAGMSVFRWFTFIFLFITLLEQRDIRLQRRQLVPLFLFAFYCILVVAPDNLQRAVFAVLDMVCILVLLNQYLHVSEHVKSFFSVYAITALCAFLTGTQREALGKTMMFDGQLVEMERNTATFEDPNYMGYFYTTAIFALVALRLFNPRTRTVIVLALYAMMLSSLSVTAIVMNAVLWLVYLFVTRKISIKTLIVIAVVIALLVGLYQYGLSNPDTPVIGGLSMRVATKLDEAQAGDYNSVTSNRTNLLKRHWKYYADQPLHKQLFGMNAASMLKMDLGGNTISGHNEYVDLLLNVGLVGALLLFGFFFRNLWCAYQSYRKEGDTRSLCIVMGKVLWLGYAFTLTVYGDFRFYLLFFL